MAGAVVILNQPQPRAAAGMRKLQAQSVASIELAFHRLMPVADALDSLERLDPQGFDRIVFVSPSSVTFSADRLRDRLPPGRVAVMGQGTATILAEQRLIDSDAELIRPRQPPFDADALMRLPQMQPDQFRSVLVICGEQGRSDWIERYQGAGVQVERVPVYRSQPMQPTQWAAERITNLAEQHARAVLVVGSVSEFNALRQWLDDGHTQRGSWLRAQPAVVPHRRIGDALLAAGWQQVQATVSGQTLLQAALELAA